MTTKHGYHNRKAPPASAVKVVRKEGVHKVVVVAIKTEEADERKKENAVPAVKLCKVKVENVATTTVKLAKVKVEKVEVAYNTESSCTNCGRGMGCQWLDDSRELRGVGDNLIKYYENEKTEAPPRAMWTRNIRFQVYRRYARIHHPGLQRGERIVIPTCIVNKIRAEWPNAEGSAYVGHANFTIIYQ